MNRISSNSQAHDGLATAKAAKTAQKVIISLLLVVIANNTMIIDNTCFLCKYHLCVITNPIQLNPIWKPPQWKQPK